MTVPKSLQCPRCNGSVVVADHAAGKRVKCPHCEQSFLAPGIAATSDDDNDEDDWLTLSDSPSPVEPASDNSNAFFADTPLPPSQRSEVPPSGAPSTDAGATTNGKENRSPALSSSDEALLSKHTDSATPHSTPIPAGNSNTIDAIRALGTAGAGTTTPKNPEAQSIEYESEFRVNCLICGSLMYAKATDSGKTTKCSDCHSAITIPQPPKVRKKSKIDIENAETFKLDQPNVAERTRDPFQKSADDLLAEASREEEEETTPVYTDTPNIIEWLNNIFGIFKDPGVLMHWIVLSVAAAIPTALLMRVESQAMQLLLTFGMIIGGMVLGAVTVSCAFAIMLSVSNDDERVEEWPSLDISHWFDQLILVLAATGLAAIPIWSICFITDSQPMLSVAITMFSIYVLLPFLLLSMLDMNSIFTPFSPELAKSISKCQEAWGGFYFSSGLLFTVLFLFITLTWSMDSAIGLVAAIALTIGITFTYFGMMGRLAYSIGQSINGPAMKNDIDRSRPGDPK